MIRILFAEDHVLVRQGLTLLLSTQADFDVVGQTGNGAAVEALVRELRPDLVLLDLDLPGMHGHEVAAGIKERFPTVRMLILTGDTKTATVRRALAVGADGYMVKSEDCGELLDAIRTVLTGRQYISKQILDIFEKEAAANQAITPREQEIIAMISRGLRNEDIAAALSRSVFTIRKHRQNLMQKLQLHNAVEVTTYAMKHDL